MKSSSTTYAQTLKIAFSKWRNRGIATSLISTSILFMVSTPHIVLGHSSDGYSHDSSIGSQHKDWMKSLSGDLRLSELSLPGTHDTLAFHGGDTTQTQSMSLATQLSSGIRVFDIRARHIENSFAIHHGIVFQKAFFGKDVMEPMIKYLDENPSETLLMRIKEEYKPEKNTRSFEETFEWYKSIYGSHVWIPTSQNPTLRDVRGKIVILQDFVSNPPSEHGINYEGLEIQDNYKVSTNWDLYRKWNDVKRQIEKAENGSRDNIYVNYLSASGGSFPYFIASGHSSPGTSASRLATGLTTPGFKNKYPDFPRVSCFIGICTIAFEGTNELTTSYIRNKNTNFTGIIMADFPGRGLINEIISLNKSKKAGFLTMVHMRNGSNSSHTDTFMEYQTWGKGGWTAKIDENGVFHHQQTGKKSGHVDTKINYISWDGLDWTATIDPKNKKFKHVNRNTGEVHHSNQLNYLYVDDTQWSVRLQ